MSRERVYGNVHSEGGSQPPMMIVFYRRYHLLDPMWNVRYLGLLQLQFSCFSVCITDSPCLKMYAL